MAGPMRELMERDIVAVIAPLNAANAGSAVADQGLIHGAAPRLTLQECGSIPLHRDHVS